MDDPYGVLGLRPDASWEEVCSARRRLAKALHPDVNDAPNGDAERGMALVNQAFDQVRAAWPGPPPEVVVTAPVGAVRVVTPCSFTVDALAVPAFDALLMAAVELGDVVQVDEPDLLGVLVDYPGPCHCLFELTPEAGGTRVTIDAAPRPFGECPGVAAVRDAFVDEMLRQAGA